MANPDCIACGHAAAFHNVNGCRLNGCGCAELVGPEGRRQDPAERALRAQRETIAALNDRVDWLTRQLYAALVVSTIGIVLALTALVVR